MTWTAITTMALQSAMHLLKTDRLSEGIGTKQLLKAQSNVTAMLTENSFPFFVLFIVLLSAHKLKFTT
jgi:hypothetical protein